MCETCRSDDLDLVEALPDGRRRIRCNACGHEWLRGDAKRVWPTAGARGGYAAARERFPRDVDVDPARRARVEELKTRFLETTPQPAPAVTEYWARYQEVFSEAGIEKCDAADLKDFANHNTGGGPGNQSVFNSAWNRLGERTAAERTRHSIRYLLHGRPDVPLEDRLTEVIEDDKGRFMPGFKESLLTKVLCVWEPDRFVPVLKYTTPKLGKKEIAQVLFGVTLPDPARTSATIGRLIVWSNDLLLGLAGEGFATPQHLADFLWHAARDELAGAERP